MEMHFYFILMLITPVFYVDVILTNLQDLCLAAFTPPPLAGPVVKRGVHLPKCKLIGVFGGAFSSV